MDDLLEAIASIATTLHRETFARKSTEIRDRIASIKLQLDAVDRSRDEMGELASKVFELSQTLREKWLSADCDEKRRILEIVCLNFTLVDLTLVPTIRKPFDMLAEGLLVQSSRGDCRTVEPLAELVDPFVAAIFEIAPARLDSLAEVVATGKLDAASAAKSTSPAAECPLPLHHRGAASGCLADAVSPLTQDS